MINGFAVPIIDAIMVGLLVVIILRQRKDR